MKSLSNIIKSSYVNLGQKKRIHFEKAQPSQENHGDLKYNNPSSEEVEAIKAKIVTEANSTAQSIIENAKQEASQIIRQAKIEADKQTNEIFEENRRTGYEKGYHEGKAESDQMKKQAKQLLQDAMEQKEEIFSNIEPQIVDLIVSILKKLLYDTVELNPEVILYLIRKGLNHVTESREITLKISHEDHEVISQEKQKILGFLDQDADIHIVKDGNLQKGDCIIDTNFGSIDCRLEEQFTALKRDLYYILNHDE